MRTRLGQNFLRQPQWIQRVAAAAGVTAGDRVVEVGGGAGDLTALLAATACDLTVVELDARLAAGLRARFADVPRVRVIEADVLQLDWAALGSGPLRVVGNLPYYISSPILRLLCANSRRLRDATLMLQKEVADRLLAQSGTRAFGLLTVATQVHATAQRLFDLPPGAFRPAPKVHSTLLRLEFLPQPRVVDIAGFESFLREAFGQKRKRMVNNFPAAERERIAAALAACGVPPGARAEQLSLLELAGVFERRRTRTP